MSDADISQEENDEKKKKKTSSNDKTEIVRRDTQCDWLMRKPCQATHSAGENTHSVQAPVDGAEKACHLLTFRC